MSSEFETLKSMLAVINDALQDVVDLQQKALAEVKEINEASQLRDSIEIGTPGKGGVAKCYFSAADTNDARRRIDTVIWLRTYAYVTGTQTHEQSEGGTKLPPMPDCMDTTG